MNWHEIGKTLAKVAPLAGALLTGPAGTAVSVGGLIAKALGSDPDPVSVAQALRDDPAAFERVKKFEIENETALTRLHLEAETAQLAEVNKTMRAEAASLDPYVRRWRPTFGYSVAISWTLQMLGLTIVIGWAVVKHPTDAATIIDSVAKVISALMVLWGVALSVLGINAKKRSDDKHVAAGQPPPMGMIGALVQRISGAK
ncbi:MAG: holin family protein [Desulfobulbaceae bacterium]|nr:holin family protein [Desulfobulbaceae bacterium]